MKRISRAERYECGEGHLCSIGPLLAAMAGPIAGAAVGGLFGLAGAKEQSNAQAAANEANQAKFYGPGLTYAPGILSDAQRLYGQGAFAPQANPLELLGRSNELGYAEGALPGLIGQAQQSWLQGLNPSLNPYVGAMIQSAQNDLVQDYQRNVMPSISNQAQGAGVGGFGGARQGVAQGIASEGLLEGLGDISTRMLGNAYGQGLQQQQAAWNQMPNMLNAGFLPGSAQQRVGGLYRGDANIPAQNLIGYNAMVAPWAASSQGYQSQPLPSAMGGFLTGAGAGLGAWDQYGGLFKTNPQTNINVSTAGANAGLGAGVNYSGGLPY